MIIETGQSPHDEDTNIPMDIEWVWVNSGRIGYWVRAENAPAT